jgi:hypothetical protein
MLVFAGCAAAEVVIVTSGDFYPSKGHKKASVLDLRIERVEISGVTMEEAIFRLADGIASSTKGRIKFAVSTQNSRDLMDRVRKRNPSVSLEQANVSLRDVINDLCRQSGWSYTKTDAGYVFTDDDRFFRRE